MGFSFGKRSQKQLDTCHQDLIKIANVVIKRSKVDFGISEGRRSLSRQYQLFLQGKTKIDGRTKKGKHNFSPSEALDVFAYHPDLETRRKLAYDKSHLAYLAGLFDSVASELYEKGEITHLIRWGANWDSDGIIDFDQDFDDFPHFEIVKTL